VPSSRDPIPPGVVARRILEREPVTEAELVLLARWALEQERALIEAREEIAAVKVEAAWHRRSSHGAARIVKRQERELRIWRRAPITPAEGNDREEEPE
jgi:hypothetical protein